MAWFKKHNDSEELKKVKQAIDEHTKSGTLSKSDINKIMEVARKQYDGKTMPDADRHKMETYIEHSVVKAQNKLKVSTKEKFFAIANMAICLLVIPIFIYYAEAINRFVHSGNISQHSNNTLVLSILGCVFLGLAVVAAFLASVFMLRNKRGFASKTILVSVACTVLSTVMSLMISGLVVQMIWILVFLILQIVIVCYLQPQLHAERTLQYDIHLLCTELLAKKGILGYGESKSKGFIKLDFFNLFWIWIIGSILGLICEDIFHVIFIWEPGVFKDRAGLLWGPFSPIYGFGAVLMTIALNRFKDSNDFIVFAICTVIGGAFEYFVSWFLEVSYGIQAWDYSDQFLSIGGRTCLAFASMFGILGLVWIKFLLPRFMILINKIPWKLRYTITSVFAAFMLVNGLMTLIAFDCWNSRVAGNEPVTPIEQFYAKNFGDDFMQGRFESMSIDPNRSARSEVSQ